MTVDEEGNEFTCAAGREADFGGRWLLPCHIPRSRHQHVLVTVAGELTFCDEHMEALIAAGLITNPYVSREGAEHLAQQELGELIGRPLFGPWREP